MRENLLPVAFLAFALTACSSGAERNEPPRTPPSTRAAAPTAPADTLESSKKTDRGLVVTFGDVLFESAQAELRAAARPSLENLSAFLHRNPGRNVRIEGYAGNAASGEYERQLAASRADAVRGALIRSGIADERIQVRVPAASSVITDEVRRVDVVIPDAGAIAAMAVPTLSARGRTS